MCLVECNGWVSRVPLIPKFRLFGENDSRVEESIQSRLEFWSWVDLSENEKSIAVQQLINRKWLTASDEILETINYLNTAFLRTCPGTNLHSNPIILEYGQVSNGHVRKLLQQKISRLFLSGVRLRR